MTSGQDEQSETTNSQLDVAILAVAGRFPGARDVDEFWRNLCAGEESIALLSAEELREAGVDDALLAQPNYVRAHASLAEVDLFDAELFGFTPQEAAALDPQHRVFLECAWEAFERAGYDPERITDRVGVYAGSSLNGYLFHLFPNGARVQSAEDLAALLALDKDFLATRVSYKLNLRGPSVAVQTACSTSLVSVHLACQALLLGECELALAGGVSISIPQQVGYLYQEGGIASPDGHCRAFDAAARGTVAGSGAGVVLLKRLADAQADGDPIVAVIKGSAINNDGRGKIGFTAPSVEGQARVIREAHLAAGVEPSSIGYVEAHGTGTPLGDPVEVMALTRAFGEGSGERGFCALGSVKTNVGHLDAAAGVAGLIKAALALAHRHIPKSLHFARSNPAIDFANTPFYVAAAALDWEGQRPNGSRARPEEGPKPRRAGVSSFGIGGTNAHVVLEEAPPSPCRDTSDGSELIVLSARSPAALERYAGALAERLDADAGPRLADLAYTLQRGRRGFPYRRAFVCDSRAQAVRALRTPIERAPTPVADARAVAFLFPGQGAQRSAAGRALYASEPRFREQIDACAVRLEAELGLDLRVLLFPEPAQAELAERERARTSRAQPALFVLEYALARTFMAYGLTPCALLGHSVGEYVAACLAGTFSLEDALRLIALRGRLMESTPEGAMLAVSASEAELAWALSRDVALAAVNGPRQCVLAGSPTAIEQRERELAARDVSCRRLRVARAFHSPLMDGVLAPFRSALASSTLHAPRLRWVSNVTGTWISAAEAQDPEYWLRHLRGTVRFAEGVETLIGRSRLHTLTDRQTSDAGAAAAHGGTPNRGPTENARIVGRPSEGPCLLELGPGETLSALCRQLPCATVAALPEHDDRAARGGLLETFARLWEAGAALDWSALSAVGSRRRVALPATPFERKRHWVDAPQGRSRADTAHESAPQRDTTRAPLLYVPSWKRAPLAPSGSRSAATEDHWLIFAADEREDDALVEQLARAGARVTRVARGDGFARLAQGGLAAPPAGTAPAFARFVLRPDQPEHYRELLRQLAESGGPPTHVVHAFALASGEGELDRDFFQSAQARGLASLLSLVRALAGEAAPAELIVLANGLHDLTGREELHPEHATLLGAVRSIAVEQPEFRARLIDLESAAIDPQCAAKIVGETGRDACEPVVVYRGPHRWLPSVEPLAVQEAPESSDAPAALAPQVRGSDATGPERELRASDRPVRPEQARADGLRQHGVYWITGGLGGVGLEFAEYLARAARARLVLSARSSPDETQRERVRALERLGAEVFVLAADVADPGAMGAALREVSARFGALHGVIHAAGVAEGGLLAGLRALELERELAPKAQGALVLCALVRELRPDFVLLCSSLTALSGGVAQTGYAAANAFLDAYACAARRRGERVLSVGFDRFQGVGMAARAQARLHSLGLPASMFEGISRPQAQRILPHLFRQLAAPHILVSARALAGMPKDEVGTALRERLRSGAAAGSPAQASAEIAARGASLEVLTATMQEIWARAFGLERVEPDRDFYELGGESLLALQILNRVREVFAVELPLRDLFEQRSAAALAQRVHAARSAASTAENTADGEPALVALPRRARPVSPQGQGER